jgi:hypothetical protein
MTVSRNGFQTFVTTQQPPAQAGDFASMNPRAVALTSQGPAPGLTPGYRVAAAQAVTVGFFAWGAPATGLVYSSAAGAGAGAVIGFVANELQTIITAFLGASRVTVETGFPVTLFTAGDFWAEVAGLPVVAGDPIYAVIGTGQPTTDDDSSTGDPTGYIAATSAPAPATSTASTVAASTGVLTTSGAVPGGTSIQSGMNVTMTGLPANTFVVSQISGTPGAGAGATYQLNYQGPAVTSATATFSQGNLVKITRQLPPSA